MCSLRILKDFARHAYENCIQAAVKSASSLKSIQLVDCYVNLNFIGDYFK
jgi:hypothetical protein